MKSCRFLRGLVYFALGCSVFVFCGRALAQATTASLTGFVDDPSKAVIPKVSVTAINTQTGVKTKTFTNSAGEYTLPSLEAGSYRIEVDKQGFKGIIEAGLTLHVQDIVQINFHMAVGSMSETVTVNDSTQNMNTTDGTVSTVIDKTLIENMPLNGKDLTTLFELSPGTILNAGGPPSEGGGFSVDGQRPTSNYLTIDGASGNSAVYPNSSNVTGSGIATSASGGTNGILPIDAIEEYRMDTSTYTAENGRTPGGQVQVRTRGGSNHFHGTLFENLRNQVLDDTDWFAKYDGIAQSQLRMNDFGGTLGGPILKNKLFFFVANDNLILDQPNTSSKSDVPSASLASQAYSTFQKFLGGFPAGNTSGGSSCPSADPDCDPSNPGFDFFSASYPYLVRDHTTSIRVDAQLPRSLHAFFRANLAPSKAYEYSYDGFGTDIDIYTYTGGATIPVGTNLVDELTVNHTSTNAYFSNFISEIGGNNPNAIGSDLPIGVSIPKDEFVFGIASYNFGALSDIAAGGSSGDKLFQWNVVDSLSWTLGKHSLKFGVDNLKRTSSITNVANLYEPFIVLSQSAPYVDLDTGNVDDLIYTHNANLPSYSIVDNSIFVNDDWRIDRNLTINAGLRWEYNPPPSAESVIALQGTSLAPATIQASVSNKPLYQTRYDNFAPRFGFAWSPFNHSSSATVVRGGVGVYFDTGQAATSSNLDIGNYPYNSSQTYTTVMPYSSIDWAGLAVAPSGLPVSKVALVDPNLVSPRTYEWSLTLEQQFGKDTTLSASYVGNDGEKLIGEEATYNEENSAGQYPVNTSLVEPYGYLYILTNQSHSNYQALQAQVSSKMGPRLTALASYTLAHAEDNGETDFSSVGAAASNPIANSANDIRHVFAAAIHYAPAGLTGNRIMRAFTGGWALDTITRLQTAAPFSVTEPYDPNPNSFIGNANVVLGAPIVLHEHLNSYGAVVPGNKLLNWEAFTAPPTSSSGQQLQQGDSPINGYRLFGLTQWDLAASRTWMVWKALDLNFRIDAFNLINIPSFSDVQSQWTSSDSSTFGMASSTYASANGALPSGYGQSGQQLNVFQNGGPREVELSVKLKF